MERVAELLRAEIARVLREEVTDPRVALVTVLRVDPSPDLRNALVFWSRLEAEGAPPRQAVAEGLASAAPFVRRQLARSVRLKRMPALEFRFDASLEEGDRTLTLLRELRDEPR